MQVKSIAEWSKGSILQYFGPALSNHMSFIILYVYKIGITNHLYLEVWYIWYLCKKYACVYVGLKVFHDVCIILYTCKSSLYFILVFFFFGGSS